MSTQIQLKRGTAADLTAVNLVLAEGEPGYEIDTGKFKIGDGTTAWNALPYTAALATHPHAISDVTNLQTTLNEKLTAAPSNGGTYARKDGAWVYVSEYKNPQLNPKGMARLVSVRPFGNISTLVRSSTGYIAVRWWDGSVNVFGAGVPTGFVTASKAVPTTGNWTKSAPKEMFIWSCTAGNAQQSGNLTLLQCHSNSLTALEVSGLPALTTLICSSNSLTSLDVSGCTALTSLSCGVNSLTALDASGCTALVNLVCDSNALTSLDASGLTALNHLFCSNNLLTSLDVSGRTALNQLFCNNNSLTALDVSGCTALTGLSCQNNSLTALDVSGLTALTTLTCDSNSLTSLDVSGLTALTTLFCSNNSLTSLDVSGLTALIVLQCNSNSLTSVRATAVSLGGWAHKMFYSAFGASDLSGNFLDAAALDQFYTDLDPGTPGASSLNVAGNPGTATHDPSIATNKGYVVFD